MASSYSTDLSIELVATGEKAGLWGAITNTNLQLLQTAASGYVEVTLNTGNAVVSIDIDVLPSGVDLTLATGNVTITVDANISPTGNALSLNTVEPGVITWNDIIPGATMVWTPIKPVSYTHLTLPTNREV